MKSEERQALQQNELEQEYVGHLKPFLEKYGRLVALVAVAVVLLFVAFSVWRGANRANREAGWPALFEAQSVAELEAVADEELSGTTNATAWAHLRAGNTFLATASGAAFTDRKGAEDDLASAKKHFEAALAFEGAPSAVRAQALYGLASVEEATSAGDVKAATDLYNRLIADYPSSPLVPAAELRLETLKRSSTGPFLAWFDKQNPQQEDLARPLDNVPAEDGDDALLPGVEGAAPDAPAAPETEPETADAPMAPTDASPEPVASETSESTPAPESDGEPTPETPESGDGESGEGDETPAPGGE
ncbi:tol-pal system YbgF family protein [Alienimonas sp. DA493]|uniref:tetratricopeptide repeat protein n=1 Tax=Alienimonas sp. DA493 TaxID=3373605 RepID=UPI0037541269